MSAVALILGYAYTGADRDADNVATSDPGFHTLLRCFAMMRPASGVTSPPFLHIPSNDSTFFNNATGVKAAFPPHRHTMPNVDVLTGPHRTPSRQGFARSADPGTCCAFHSLSLASLPPLKTKMLRKSGAFLFHQVCSSLNLRIVATRFLI